MADRFEELPETFDQMMLLPNMPDFHPSHRHLTKIHQIETACCTLLKKEENKRTKGWTVPLSSTRRHVNPPLRTIEDQVFFPPRGLLFLSMNRKSVIAFACNDDLGKASSMESLSQRL
jgi:hypothetical protein